MDKDIRTQGHKDIRAQGHKGTRTQGHKDIRAQGHKGTRTQGYRDTMVRENIAFRDWESIILLAAGDTEEN